MKNTWADAVSKIPSDGSIFLGGCCAEPSGFYKAIAEDPEIGRDRDFFGVWIPGVNKIDPSSASLGATAKTIFVTPELQKGITAGRVKVLPIQYSSTFKMIASGHGISGAIFQVTPPNNGTVGLGLSADFVPAAISAKIPLIGQINSEMPDLHKSIRIPVSDFTCLIDEPAPLLEYKDRNVSPVYKKIAENIAEILRPGDTVQIGIGKLHRALLEYLTNFRDLGFHSGLLSDQSYKCAKSGVFGRGLTAGVALGSSDFYKELAKDKLLKLSPVSSTHFPEKCSYIENFVAINSILQCDLFGQVNSEYLNGKQITGQGGLLDFTRTANFSKGGKTILSLPSTAKNGSESRIVSSLDPLCPITIPRSDVDWLVTEHGSAQLKHLDAEQRAEKIISLASPDFRDKLFSEWELKLSQIRKPSHKTR